MKGPDIQGMTVAIGLLFRARGAWLALFAALVYFAAPGVARAQAVCAIDFSVNYNATNVQHLLSMSQNVDETQACDPRFYANQNDPASGVRPTPQSGATANGGSFTATTNAADNTIVYNAPTGFSGIDTFTITFCNDASCTGALRRTATVSVTVGTPTITVNPATLPNATVTVAYSQTLTGSGGQAPYGSFTVISGALPAGLSLATGGALTGTPTASGTFTFAVRTTDNSGGDGPFQGSRAYTLTVNAPTITIGPTTLPAGRQSSAYSQTITASGGTAPSTFAVTAGALPAGLTLAPGGALTGIPTVNGSFNFAVTATDSSTGTGPYTGSRAYTLVIAPPPAPVANAVSATIAYNSSANPITLNITGGAATSVATPGLPAHGTVNVVGTTITYTPTAGYFGADSFTYTATGPGGTSAPATVSLTVATPAAPTAADLSGVAVPYDTATTIDVGPSITGVHASIAVATAPSHGTTSIAGDVVTYTPTAGYYGADSFTYTATGPGGTSAPATISLTIAPPPTGQVTLSVESPSDGTTIFSSPEPSLNVSIATIGGSGTSGVLTVPAGTFAITFALPDNNSAKAFCTDPSSTLDVASRSGTITVVPGASQTCTLALSDISKTTELIGDMLSARGRMILANQPDSSRRIDRLTGNYRGQGGVSGLGLGFSDENIPVAIRFSQDEVSFAYSLRRSGAKSGIDSRIDAAHGAAIGRAGGVGPTVSSDDEGPALLSAFTDGDGQTTSLDAVQGLAGETQPEVTDPMATPFDIWAEGKIAKFSAGGGDGHFGILHAGADYLITPRLLIGLGAQLDWTDLDGEGASSIDGIGFLVGPYVTARLTDNLYFDGRAAWGTSSNTVSPFGTYDDKVDGNRWLVSGALIGSWDVDRWRIEPTARLSYFEETTDAYLDGLNFSIPQIESATGTLEFGPTVRYRFARDELQLEPFATLEGVWTFEQKNTGSAATSAPGTLDTGLRGRIEAGLSLVGVSIGSLSLSGFYDGIGDGDFEAYGGRLRVAHRF